MRFHSFTRRSAGIAAAAALVVAMAGCSAGGDSSPTESGDAAVLNYSFIGPPVLGMNPLKTFGGQSSLFYDLAYSTVLHMQPDGTIVGDLATEWGYVGEGNMAFDFTLREDSTFGDGTPVDAAAVVASLEAARDGGFFKSSLWKDFETIEATGDYSVSMTFSQPIPNVEQILTSTLSNGYIINPAALADPESLDNATDGSGPYVYDATASVTNTTYTYVRNEDYYNPDVVTVDKSVVKVLSDPNAVLSAVRTGQVDVGFGDSSLASAAKDAGIVVASAQDYPMTLSLLDRAGEIVPALGDVRVRQAINYALDRDGLTEALAPSGLGVPTAQVALEGKPGYSSELGEAYAYDPERAKELLAEAGYADGFTFELLCTPLINTCTTAEAVAADLGKVGITAEINSVGGSIAEYDGLLASGSVPASIQGLPNSIFQFGPYLTPNTGGSYNPFLTDDPVVIDLFAELSAASDPTVQDDLALQITSYVSEQAWYAPIYVIPSVYFLAPAVTGFDVTIANPFWQPVDPTDSALTISVE